MNAPRSSWKSSLVLPALLAVILAALGGAGGKVEQKPAGTAVREGSAVTAGARAEDVHWDAMFKVMYLRGQPAKDSRLEELKLLLDRGADVNMAIGFDRMLRVGETRADLRPTNWPLDVAAAQGRADMVNLLLARGAKVHGKELAKAAFARNPDDSFAMIAALLKAGADVNSRDDGFSAIQWASYRGHTNSVKLLLAQPGIKLDEGDHDGRTALMTAAEHGHAEIVDMLLGAGASINIINKNGETAATLARKTLAQQQATVEKQRKIISKLQSPLT